MKLVGVDGEELVKRLPSPKEVFPVGSFVAFEVLKEHETIVTTIALPEFKNSHMPTQAVITRLGPKVDPSYNLAVGDRVIFNRSSTPTPVMGSNGRQICLTEANNIKAVLIMDGEEVVGIKPVGNCLVFEMLTNKDVVATNLQLPDDKGTISNGPPQAIITGIGGRVEPTWGFEIGDRIVLSGGYLLMPLTHNGRNICVTEFHNVKAVLTSK